MTEGRLAPEEVRTRTFTRVLRGYRRREVRRLLERAADDLVRLREGPAASGPDDQPPLTPEEVEEVRFQSSLGGYEMDEVDEFLDQLMVALERAAREPSPPPSALPAPVRHAAFPTVTPAPQPAAPGVQPATPGPAPGAPESQPATPGPPPGAPGSRPTTPGPPPATHDHRSAPSGPRPAGAGPLPAGAGPLPAGPPTAPPAPGTAPGPAGAPGPPAPPPGPPGPSPAGTDEGFFPPPSVPPSAAPAPPPPQPAAPSPPPPPTVARPLTPAEVETRSFDRGAPGYLPAHVDLFLAKAARALAGRDGETLTRWDVLRQRFPLGPRGYATGEVDAFLVRLAAQFPDPDPATQQEILRKLQDG
jgi:DivIVA domain-containing protein